MSDTVQRRIRERLKELGLSERAAGMKAGLSPTTVRDILTKTASPRHRTLQRLAEVLETTVSYLTGDEEASGLAPPSLTEVGVVEAPLIGTIRAGAFQMVDIFDDLPPQKIPVARDKRFPHARLMCFMVEGDSMNLANIQHGDLIVTVNAMDAGLAPRTGNKVVVERTKDGWQTMERTVKEIAIFRDRTELRPRSSNPNHETIVIPASYMPGDEGFVVAEDGSEVRIIAYVLRTMHEIEL